MRGYPPAPWRLIDQSAAETTVAIRVVLDTVQFKQDRYRN